MKELGLDAVHTAVSEALAAKDKQRMGAMLFPALDQFPDDPILHHFAAHYYTHEDRHVSALMHAERAQELEPTAGNLTNLGSIYRRLNLPDKAYRVLEEAIGYDPTNKHPWNNLAASYCNEGNPLPGLEAAREAVRIDPDFDKARWNKGLLELELGNFAEGFDDYRAGLVIGERLLKNYATDDGKEPEFLTDLKQLKDFTKQYGVKPRVIVWGEQGLGDEIMFSTILPDLANNAEIIFDCHPRMEKIMRDSYLDVSGVFEIYPTRKEKEAPWYKDTEPCHFKCSIGDLPRWYRRKLEDFHEAREWASPWLTPDKELVERYRAVLEELAPNKKYVGFGWTGGIISTQRWYRSAQLAELSPMLLHDDIQPVSLQYEDDTASVQDWYEQTGKLVFRFPGITTHFDYHHTLALVEALDAVVTVCQSVAHLSAAAGQKTLVLVPDKPAWRYGLEGKDWYWYENAQLYRRPGEDWKPAVKACARDLFEHFGWKA